jgi:type I restriction enzyme S subunit
VAEIDAKVGGFGLVPPDLEGAIVSSHYFLFVANEDRLDRRFLGWFIKTPAFREQVEAQGSTNYAAIRPDDVLNYEIPLPLEEQQRIVARIEDLAVKIAEACSLRQQAIEEMASLYSSTISALSRLMKSEMRTVGEIVGEDALRNGRSVKASDDRGTVRCLMPSAMRRGRIDLAENKAAPLTLGEARPFSFSEGMSSRSCCLVPPCLPCRRALCYVGHARQDHFRTSRGYCIELPK